MRLQSFYEKYINQVPPDASVKYPVLVMPELLQDALLEANNILEISNTDELTTPDNAKKILEYYGVHDNLDVVYAGYNGEILIRGSYYAFDFDAYYKKITAYFIDNFFNGVRW